MNHKWSVYVNQVGADAEVRSEKTRCIAAGYLWNPYLVVSGDEVSLILQFYFVFF